jgi:hypothetical protein
VRHPRAAAMVLRLAIVEGTAVQLTVVGQHARALPRTAEAVQCRRITDRRRTVVVAAVVTTAAARRRITAVEAAAAALTVAAEVADRTAEVAEATPAVIANL